MKWIGQHIWSFISRFRNQVYFEKISSGTPNAFISVDSDKKVITGGKAASTTVSGIVELATTAETTTGTDTTRAVTPDGLKDGYQGSSNITTVGTVTSGDWRATALATDAIADDAVTYAKIQNVTNARMLGNNAGSDGIVTEMTKANVLSFLNVADGATTDQTNVTGSSGSCTGNAATATALTSGDKTISGDLTVTSGTSGDATLIISADTDNNDENDSPRLWFKADGDIIEGAIQHKDNTFDFISNVSANGGIRFLTGTTNNTGTTDPETGATEKMKIDPAGLVTITHTAADSGNGLLIVRSDTSTTTNDLLGAIGFDSTDGNVPSSTLEGSAYIAAYASEAHSTGDKGGYLTFGVSPINQNDDTVSTEALRVTELLTTVVGGLSVGGDLTVTGNILPSITQVKILPRDFIPDDAGRPAMIDDTGSDRWLESHGTAKLYANVEIPQGFMATHVHIYGSATSAITVYEADVNSKTVTSKGSGHIGTNLDITDVTADATNYILIELAQASGEEVYGGIMTIATA